MNSPVPAGVTQAQQQDIEHRHAFEIGKLWALTRDNLGNVILALTSRVVAGLIAAVVGSLGFLLCVGFLITVPLATLWQYLVQAHLFGQIGRYSVTPIE